jgi:integron integrase
MNGSTEGATGAQPFNGSLEKREPKLLDRVREAMRVRHLSLRTEKTYVQWIRRYILFHGKRHPQEMAEAEINAFLTHLAVKGGVSPSTQTQALCAILFLYRIVLGREVGELEGLVRAQRKRKLPVVLTQDEVKSIFTCLTGVDRLFLSFLYGTGMRLTEALRVRVKDIDFGYDQITVRDGKGAKDRMTMLPASIKARLQEHLQGVKKLHESDLRMGSGRVHLPYALARKYPTRRRSGDGSSSFLRRLFARIRAPERGAAITCMREVCRGPSTTLPGRQASPSMLLATPCATRSPLTSCWVGTTSGPCKSSWGTRASRPP